MIHADMNPRLTPALKDSRWGFVTLMNAQLTPALKDSRWGFLTPTPRSYHLDQDSFLAFEGQAPAAQFLISGIIPAVKADIVSIKKAN
ncbi:MAG: hypothetical protein M0Q16_09375, partial [Candidatus Cloacimonetes bacterium]|nr:hypothetical protein [Candidatus Cloacimonadota bacterium]MCK9185567.1 hypothetical protein [Candidatus Cloacimonadota bacterium]